MKILLATWNKTKVHWLSNGFSKLALPIIPLDINQIEDVEETGSTCAENALLKINAIGTLEKTIIIGEDSALSINALDGFPGVKTVRWMDGTDDDRSIKILEMMNNIPIEKRGAKFISSLAVLFPNGKTEIFEGIIHGNISQKLIGEEGNGYQRIFLLDNGKAIAESESGLVCKNDHRDQAITKAISKINIWLHQIEK